MSSNQQNNRSPAEQVYYNVELWEAILLQRDPKDLLDHLHVDAWLYKMVTGSAKLQRKLYLIQDTSATTPDPENVWFPYELAIWEPNRILFPLEGGDNTIYSGDPYSLNYITDNYDYTQVMPFRLHERGPEYRLAFSIDRTRVIESRECDLDLSGYGYTLTREEYKPGQQRTSKILPPSYLAMHLSDRAAGMAVTIQNVPYWPREDLQRDLSWYAHLPDANRRKSVWAPAGSTLGDLVHYIDLYCSGALKVSDVVNGMRQFWLGFVEDGEFEMNSRRQGRWLLKRDGTFWAPTTRKK